MTLKKFIAMFSFGTAFLLYERVADEPPNYERISDQYIGSYTYETIPEEYKHYWFQTAKTCTEFPHLIVVVRKG